MFFFSFLFLLFCGWCHNTGAWATHDSKKNVFRCRSEGVTVKRTCNCCEWFVSGARPRKLAFYRFVCRHRRRRRRRRRHRSRYHRRHSRHRSNITADTYYPRVMLLAYTHVLSMCQKSLSRYENGKRWERRKIKTNDNPESSHYRDSTMHIRRPLSHASFRPVTGQMRTAYTVSAKSACAEHARQHTRHVRASAATRMQIIIFETIAHMFTICSGIRGRIRIPASLCHLPDNPSIA